MLYKLIILVASVFMIYEFTKSRSTAVASIEPNVQSQIDFLTDEIQNKQFETMVLREQLIQQNAWMQLHGV